MKKALKIILVSIGVLFVLGLLVGEPEQNMKDSTTTSEKSEQTDEVESIDFTAENEEKIEIKETTPAKEYSPEEKIQNIADNIKACSTLVTDVNEDGLYEVLCNAENENIELFGAIKAKETAHDFVFALYGADLPLEFVGVTVTNNMGKSIRLGVGAEQAKLEQGSWSKPDEIGPSIFIDWIKKVETGEPAYEDANWHDNTYYVQTF